MIVPTTYPSDEGLVLSSIVRSKMCDYFGTSKPLSAYPGIVKCFGENLIGEIRSKVENVKANMAICQGIIEYCNNYSSVTLSANGSVIGAQECININDTDNVTQNGDIELNSNILFVAYSTPTIFFTDATLMESHTKANEKFFRILCLWLGVPFVDIKSYQFSKSVYIKGNGKIIFHGYSNVSTILEKVNSACRLLIDENYSYFETNGTNLPEIFERYWDIMASGIVELLNYNSIYSIDGGYGLTAGVVPVGPYVGVSEGSCEFGKDLVVRTEVEFPDIPILTLLLGTLKFNLKIPVIDIEWPTIKIFDKFGFEKIITLNLDIGKITGKISEIATLVSDALISAYNKVMDTLIKILTRMGYAYDKIVEIVNQVIAKFEEIISKIISAITAKFKEFIDYIISQLCVPIIKYIRNLIWTALQALAPIGITLFTPMFQFNVLSKFIEKLNELVGKLSKLSELFDKMINGISNFFDDVYGIIEEIVTFISDKLSFFDGIHCGEYKSTMENIDNVSVPTLTNPMPASEDINSTIAATQPTVDAAEPVASTLSPSLLSSQLDALPDESKPPIPNPLAPGETIPLSVCALPTDDVTDPNEFGVKDVVSQLIVAPTFQVPILPSPAI